MLKHISFTLATIVLLGCAVGCAPTLGTAYQKVDEIPPNKSIVYIYRRPAGLGAGVYYDVKANGTVVTTLANGGYYPHVTEPGEIEFSAKTEATESVTIDAKPGESYFLKGGVTVGFLVGRPTLTVVTKDVGEYEIAECKLLPKPEESGQGK